MLEQKLCLCKAKVSRLDKIQFLPMGLYKRSFVCASVTENNSRMQKAFIGDSIYASEFMV